MHLLLYFEFWPQISLRCAGSLSYSPATSTEEFVSVTEDCFIYMLVKLNDYWIEGRNPFFNLGPTDAFIEGATWRD
jgi:hypothetical protein